MSQEKMDMGASPKAFESETRPSLDGSEPEWHGWRVGGKSIHIGELPSRKQTCLYVEDGGVIRTLAFFPDKQRASEALGMLDKLAAAIGGTR